MHNEFKEPNREANSGKRALVLIQGSGGVRPGIWTRSVCLGSSFRDSSKVAKDFELGTMLPFIDVCKKLDIPVLVMNPNEDVPGISGSASHAIYVWEKYVKDSGFSDISIVAHSAGGGCVERLQ